MAFAKKCHYAVYYLGLPVYAINYLGVRKVLGICVQNAGEVRSRNIFDYLTYTVIVNVHRDPRLSVSCIHHVAVI